jgi:hypothetical protein
MIDRIVVCSLSSPHLRRKKRTCHYELATLLALLPLMGCAHSQPPPPVSTTIVLMQPAPVVPSPAPVADAQLSGAPAQLAAQMAAVVPREAKAVAAPSADAGSIAELRRLDARAQGALAWLERDGGRHVTPDAVKSARTAVSALSAYLDALP